jgi:hypothetical protein
MGLERVDGASETRAMREPPATPYGDVVAGLRAVITQHARADTPVSDLARALQPVTRLARARGVSAAQLILAVKEVWARTPAVHPVEDDPVASGAHLERLVSLCVERYYAD